MIRVVLVATLVLLAVALFCDSCFAEPANAEHMQQHHSDPQKDEWMRGLKSPVHGGSCCSLNDCEPTKADWRAGQWWALSHVKDQGYVPIPEDKIVTKQKSFDGQAWLCQGRHWGTIYCFVPPDMGY